MTKVKPMATWLELPIASNADYILINNVVTEFYSKGYKIAVIFDDDRASVNVGAFPNETRNFLADSIEFRPYWEKYNEQIRGFKEVPNDVYEEGLI